VATTAGFAGTGAARQARIQSLHEYQVSRGCLFRDRISSGAVAVKAIGNVRRPHRSVVEKGAPGVGLTCRQSCRILREMASRSLANLGSVKTADTNRRSSFESAVHRQNNEEY
jgi:hypothetical protein